MGSYRRISGAANRTGGINDPAAISYVSYLYNVMAWAVVHILPVLSNVNTMGSKFKKDTCIYKYMKTTLHTLP